MRLFGRLLLLILFILLMIPGTVSAALINNDEALLEDDYDLDYYSYFPTQYIIYPPVLPVYYTFPHAYLSYPNVAFSSNAMVGGFLGVLSVAAMPFVYGGKYGGNYYYWHGRNRNPYQLNQTISPTINKAYINNTPINNQINNKKIHKEGKHHEKQLRFVPQEKEHGIRRGTGFRR